MGLIKEPLDVDFYVDSRPITEEDLQAFSDYIKADKIKRAKKLKPARIIIKTKVSDSHMADVR